MAQKKQTKPEVLAISIPKKELDEKALENLKALVKTKKDLLKKALGADDLDINISDDGRINFPWFTFTGDPVESKAYTHLITALCEFAKKLKRVNIREETNVESEKYVFRCFLVRLGFVGPAFKEERKLLMKKLSGSSAFCNKEYEEHWKQMQADKRKALQETKE